MTPPSAERRYRELGLWDERRIGDLIGEQAARHPERELFCFEGQRISYGDFDAWVRTVASDLLARGVCRGDRVMVQLPNCPAALVLQAAAFRIGAVAMPIVPIYREHEVRQIVAQARPAVVAVAAQLGTRRPADELDGILAELGHRPAVRYVLDGVRLGWHAIPAAGGVTVLERPELPEPLAAQEPALLLFTSGTTSAPKGALLSSAALLAHLRNFQAALGVGADCVILCATPLSHLGGFVAGLVFPAFLGVRSVIMSSWRPDEAVEVIEREGVTLAMGATVFLADLVERYESGAGRGHRLERYVCAGAFLAPALVLRAEAVGVRALRCYGMTETAGICAAPPQDATQERRSRWDGRILPGMEIEAVDPARMPLAPGREGELRIRGPQLLTAYTDPDRTRDQFDEHGWFYPGDVGVVDADGWVRMSGRIKDIINRGGEKFSTLDIESAVASCPAVAAVAVAAVPDDRLGEAVGAWIVLAPGVVWDGPAPLVAHLEQIKLARQKFPTRWTVLPALPTTASGKVMKHALPGLHPPEENTMPERRFLLTTVEDGVGILQLDHPEKRNALGWELHHELLAALEHWAYDDDVAAVMIIGTEEYFCAGWALDVLQGTDGDERTRFTDLALRFMVALYDYRKPTIAAVAGVAPGYGMDVANMCDITIAAENAAFGSTQVKYAMNGFYHGILRKTNTQRARRMLFTGDPIDAHEALRVGLVDEVVPVGQLRESALRLAKQIAENGAELTTVLKEVALRASNMDHISATAYELRVTHDLLQRGLFTRRIADGLDRLRAGNSRATERLGTP